MELLRHYSQVSHFSPPSQLTVASMYMPMQANARQKSGACQFFGSGGCGAAGPPIEEVGPAVVVDAAFGGGQGVGARLRSAAARPLEPAPDDPLAGAFHDAGSDRQPAFPAGVAAHPALVGLHAADAGLDGLVAVAVRLQAGDGEVDRPPLSCALILSIRAFRWLLSGIRARTAAAAQSSAWNWSRMKVVLMPAKTSSQTFRIQAAPSDSATSSPASNRPSRRPNRSRRAANSDARPVPPSDRALSMRTPAAPLPLSFLGFRLSAVQGRWPSPRGSSPRRPPARPERPRPRPRPSERPCHQSPVNKLPFLTPCRHPFLTPREERIPRGRVRPRPPALPRSAQRGGARPGGCFFDFPDLRGGAACGPDQPFECCRKRQLSFPVSTISQWCVSRSSRAAVIFPSPNTDGHSENDRLVVTITDVRS